MIPSLKFICLGDKILVVSGDAQPKVLDRDGGELFQHVKGDQYVLDQVSWYYCFLLIVKLVLITYTDPSDFYLNLFVILIYLYG